MNRNNRGYEIEFQMKKWFKGQQHYSDSVDFKTKTSLYEVKACNMFNHCVNGNHKRDHAGDCPHKQISTTQLGRFFVKNYNHVLLKEISEKENKIPKYVFVVTIGKQKLWRTKSWEEIDKLIFSDSGHTALRIKDIFGGGI